MFISTLSPTSPIGGLGKLAPPTGCGAEPHYNKIRLISPAWALIGPRDHGTHGTTDHGAASRAADRSPPAPIRAELARGSLPLSLKLSIDSTLTVWKEIAAGLEQEGRLSVSHHDGSVAIESLARDTIFILPRSPSTVDLAGSASARVLLVGGDADRRGLPEGGDPALLRNILDLHLDRFELEQQLGEANALLSEVGAITRLAGMDETLSEVCSTSCTATGSQEARLYLMGPDGRLVEGTLESTVEASRVDGQSPLGRVARDRDACILTASEVAEDPRIREFLPPHGPAHCLAVSLLSEGRLIGLLVLARSSPASPYQESTLEHARILSGAAGIAIDNLRLYREARQSYDRLMATQKQLLQVEKLSSLGQLSAGIAHEINNPLFVIMGNLELAVERVDGRLKSYLQKALGNAERIKKIIMDLREFYAPSKNVFAEVRLNTILENAIPIVNLQNARSTIEFQLDLAETLPPVKGDDNQLLQVVTNILLNAVQAMPDGGKVTIASRSMDGFVLVSIADDGAGIPADQLDRIFDPFFTTKRDWTGTGLGLSVSHTIVENHMGSIEVESEAGRGTTFKIRLPAMGWVQASGAGLIQEPEIMLVNRGVSVLVVDDDENTREYIQEMLVDFGVKSDTACDAYEALRLARVKPYDLIFLDNKMPGRNGLEAVGDFRSETPDTKIVLLTGTVTIGLDEVRQLGFYGMLRKPSTRAEILEVVKQVADD